MFGFLVCIGQHQLHDQLLSKHSNDKLLLAMAGETPSKVDNQLSDHIIRKWFAISCLFRSYQTSQFVAS